MTCEHRRLYVVLITNENQSQEECNMLLTISDVMPKADLNEVLNALDMLKWEDGAKTAGRVARQVKKNQQADLSSEAGIALRNRLRTAIVSHPVISAFTQPLKLTQPIISKTEGDGGYGLHVDNPFIGTAPNQVRSDLSFTLFLSPPESYDGGHLRIESAGMTHRIKGEVGDVVVYPSTTLHEVEPVTSGARLVCIGWIESRIRRHEEREVLFDLTNLKTELSKSHDLNSIEMLTLSKSMANLKRLWSE